MKGAPETNRDLRRLRAENRQLRMENARLRGLLPIDPTEKTGNSGWSIARQIAIVLLIAISVALITLGNLLFWTGNTLVKTDRYVAATQPILQDPKVQKTVALYTTNQIFSHLDAQAAIADALPPRADFLAPQLAAQLKTQTNNLLQKAVASPKFLNKWDEVQRKQHDKVITFVRNYKGDGEINLSDVYNGLSANLKNTKLSFLADKKLPSKIGDITVVNAAWLPTAHKVVTHIDLWRTLAVVCLVVALALAVWLSRERRRVLYVFSTISIVLMLITLLAIHIAGVQIANQVEAQYADGVQRAVQIFLHPLVLQTWTILLAMVLLSFVTWVSGQANGAAVFKQQAVYDWTNRLHVGIFGDSQNSFLLWVRRYRTWIEWLIVAIITLIMLLVHLTLGGLALYAAILLVAILVVEVVAGRPEIINQSLAE